MRHRACRPPIRLTKADRHGSDVERDPLYGRARSWVRPRAKAWPIAEELLATATAPARVSDKQDANFDREWQAILIDSATQLPLV